MQTILIGLDTKINNYASVDLMQGYNYTLEAHITDNYKDMDLTGVTVQLQMQKPDKKFIIQTENIVIEGNKIKATLDKDFTREDGQAKLQVVLFKDKFTFGSWVVKAKIKPSAINDNDGQSDNKVTITEALVNKISEAENTKIELDKSIANGDVATIKGNVDNIKDVEIPKINEQLEHKTNNLEVNKADKNSVFSMANMGQDIKVAMTGGSVAVVGNGGVLNQNIAPKQISVDKIDFISVGKNKININNRGQLGEWCNYTNGNIESTIYTTTFYRTMYEAVLPNTKYTRKYGSDGTSFFDIDRKFISGTTENTYTTPVNAMYVIYNFQNYHLDEQVEIGNVSTEYEAYRNVFNGFESTAPLLDTPILKDPIIQGNVTLPSNMITIGSGGDFTKVIDGFEYAYQNNKEALLLPGTYDIVAEGANLSSGGINLPKKVYGYSATIIANLPTENWIFSPLFVPYRSNYNIEVYGLTVICNNCRYCIHDDLGSFSNYYHKFKDVTLIQNSSISATLIMPRAIGGGTGSNGYIDIENCVFSSKTPADIDYHTDWQGHQTKETVIKCRDSVFKTTITGTSIGNDVSFKNKLYVSNCLCGTELPKLNSSENFTIKQWNNVIG